MSVVFLFNLQNKIYFRISNNEHGKKKIKLELSNEFITMTNSFLFRFEFEFELNSMFLDFKFDSFISSQIFMIISSKLNVKFDMKK